MSEIKSVAEFEKRASTALRGFNPDDQKALATYLKVGEEESDPAMTEEFIVRIEDHYKDFRTPPTRLQALVAAKSFSLDGKIDEGKRKAILAKTNKLIEGAGLDVKRVSYGGFEDSDGVHQLKGDYNSGEAVTLSTYIEQAVVELDMDEVEIRVMPEEARGDGDPDAVIEPTGDQVTLPEGLDLEDLLAEIKEDEEDKKKKKKEKKLIKRKERREKKDAPKETRTVASDTTETVSETVEEVKHEAPEELRVKKIEISDDDVLDRLAKETKQESATSVEGPLDIHGKAIPIEDIVEVVGVEADGVSVVEADITTLQFTQLTEQVLLKQIKDLERLPQVSFSDDLAIEWDTRAMGGNELRLKGAVVDSRKRYNPFSKKIISMRVEFEVVLTSDGVVVTMLDDKDDPSEERSEDSREARFENKSEGGFKPVGAFVLRRLKKSFIGVNNLLKDEAVEKMTANGRQLKALSVGFGESFANIRLIRKEAIDQRLSQADPYQEILAILDEVKEVNAQLPVDLFIKIMQLDRLVGHAFYSKFSITPPVGEEGLMKGTKGILGVNGLIIKCRPKIEDVPLVYTIATHFNNDLRNIGKLKIDGFEATSTVGKSTRDVTAILLDSLNREGMEVARSLEQINQLMVEMLNLEMERRGGEGNEVSRVDVYFDRELVNLRIVGKKQTRTAS